MRKQHAEIHKWVLKEKGKEAMKIVKKKIKKRRKKSS